MFKVMKAFLKLTHNLNTNFHGKEAETKACIEVSRVLKLVQGTEVLENLHVQCKFWAEVHLAGVLFIQICTNS